MAFTGESDIPQFKSAEVDIPEFLYSGKRQSAVVVVCKMAYRSCFLKKIYFPELADYGKSFQGP
jgi:hypothetical protein